VKIASFNINGIKARLPRLMEWLEQVAPDAVCLQEIKSADEGFPRLEFEDIGWHLAIHGQKGRNGVAILARAPIENVTCGLPGDEDDAQARYIEATVDGVRLASIYLPNGNPVGTEKFSYKLSWMDRLTAHARDLLATERACVLAGDFNVIATPEDCHDPSAWADDALFQPESRAKFRELLFQGWTDAIRQIHPKGAQFTYWDYQGAAWAQGRGIRIDHLLLSPQAADRLTQAGVDSAERDKASPSDHVPVWAELRDV